MRRNPITWTADDIPTQIARRVVITGGNSGIGFHTALQLARRGGEIVLPARTEAKSLDAIRRIEARVPNAILTPAVLDLSSLASIQAFADFYDHTFPGQSLDLLINNAGVMAVPRRELTVDGFERQFATNYLGPFALTALLFPHLKKRAGTRIVTVASEVVHQGRIEFDNLQSERRYVPLYGTYSQSKLADLIFALELQRRLTTAASPIASIAAHPGISYTGLTGNTGGLLGIALPFVTAIIGQDAQHGALPTLYAATSPNALPGGYYGPNGFLERRGYPVPARIPSTARDQDVAARLWDETEKLTGVSFDLETSRSVKPERPVMV
jgi:NAD(P)-dependent dehydrogenase (short-subunit alcohol dehydrogenase family)